MSKNKNEKVNLMPTKPQTLLTKISKEHRIRFENSHNHSVNSKISPFIKLIWEQRNQLTFATIARCNPQMFIIFSKETKH